MLKTQIHCLHGFLGQPGDLELPFRSFQIETHSLDLNFVHYDFFSPRTSIPEGLNLNELGNWINQSARGSRSPKVLLGYSFGGRVGLHSLISGAKNWQAAIIVSANLGLNSEQLIERQQRVKADEFWAGKFESENWDSLTTEWDSQPILAGTAEFRPRFERNYSRLRLSQVLRNCSLGVQADLREELKKIQVPILWISGEQDVKYRSIVEEAVLLNPLFRSQKIFGGGHRVLWDNPEDFVEAVQIFLKESLIKPQPLGVE